MNKKILISPSLLACKKGYEKEQIDILTSLYVDYIHFDVMDGEFVNNTSFSIEEFRKIKEITTLPLDVHIMVFNPKVYIQEYASSGASNITFHYEALESDEQRIEALEMIRSYGLKAGISIKPNTPVEVLKPLLNHLDLVLIMSVEPGLGGQSFIEKSLEKISSLRTMIDQERKNILIEVDGGINEYTSKYCVEAGVDILVAGSYLFHKEDVEKRIKLLKGE